MVPEDVVLIAVVPLLVGWILWLLFKRHQLRMHARMQQIQAFNRVVEKFGTGKEMIDFMESQAGRAMLGDLVPRVSPALQIRRFLLGGLLLGAIGVAFLLNAQRYDGMTDINYVNEAIGLNNWGTIFISCGIAVLSAGVVSHMFGRRSGR